MNGKEKVRSFLLEQNVSHETFLKIEKYIEELKKWNSKINLISPSEVECVWERHVLDSLQLLKYINCNERVLDIGSGAGFPGMLLSIAKIKKIDLIEIDKRKASFLKKVSLFSQNSIVIHNVDANKVILDNNYDVIVSRAFKNIAEFEKIAKKFAINKTKMIYMMGENDFTKLLASNKGSRSFEVFKSITNDASKIIIKAL